MATLFHRFHQKPSNRHTREDKKVPNSINLAAVGFNRFTDSPGENSFRIAVNRVDLPEFQAKYAGSIEPEKTVNHGDTAKSKNKFFLFFSAFLRG
jgi:hypothetical protein